MSKEVGMTKVQWRKPLTLDQKINKTTKETNIIKLINQKHEFWKRI